MLTNENIDKNVADDDEKCVNGNSRRNGIELIIFVVDGFDVVDINIVNIEIVITKSIKNVCNFSRTSKYGINRNSENAAITNMIRYKKYRTNAI